MITIKDPRALFNAVFGIDGVRQHPPGTVIEYWNGEPDFEPAGERKAMFMMARKLYEAGVCQLVQVQGDVSALEPMGTGLGNAHRYSYRVVVS